MTRALLPLAVAVLTACGSSASEEPPITASAQARTSARWMVDAVASGKAAYACGGAEPARPAAMLVLVNTRQALSCRDAGYMLRRLQKQSGQVWIVVPAPDTAVVCQFLSDERVRLPVVAAAADANAAATPVLALAQLRPGAPGYTLHHGRRGADILASLTLSDRSPHAEPSSNPSTPGASR